MVEYTRDQFLELYKDLPEELQEAMGSDRTTDTIKRLSNEEELNDEQHSAFVKLVGDVLLGLVPPSEFKEELVKADIKEESAKKIDQAVRRFIFYPVKDLLTDLYREKVEIPEGAPSPSVKKEEKEEKEEEKKPPSKDKYREPIE